ncbi:hypothetical protein HMPREF9711_00911 [Myroides odoratimimus CCUG 3837]|uniref:glycosyltransferase n=1 Tax=Myroides odoratimimus TaxID=76832 RepID=UPI000280AC9B|nr:glycosyltransferase [Myroides odoratimimus]EKB05942.1 hypothetical protein HMPREF9711_00911 [Myroides odoratimimus CCUG 3837]
MIKKEIFCITASYPFGGKETYFKNELEVLSKNFEKVYILPLYNPYGEIKREVPSNVIVEPVLLKQGNLRILQLIRSFSFSLDYFKELFSHNVILSSSKLKKWLISYTIYSVGSRYLNKKNLNEDNVLLYSYWANSSFFCHRKLLKFTKVIRMHGGDFYLNRNNGYLPVLKGFLSTGNVLLPISKDIEDILLTKYKIDKKKVVLSYLGVSNVNAGSVEQLSLYDEEIRIVSCSNIYELKRVDEIFRLVYLLSKSTTKKVIWRHIGESIANDGQYDKLLTGIESIDENLNLDVKLLGAKNNDEVFKFYETFRPNWFVNLSKYEGLPVSIMEAFSFGIPAIATNVGGTNEIVNSTNGFLIDSLDRFNELVKTVLGLTEEQYSRMSNNACKKWEEDFNADKNYELLIKIFIKL